MVAPRALKRIPPSKIRIFSISQWISTVQRINSAESVKKSTIFIQTDFFRWSISKSLHICVTQKIGFPSKTHAPIYDFRAIAGN